MADQTPATSGAKEDAPALKSNARLVLESPELKHLVVRRWTVSLTLLAILFIVYYGYILMVKTDLMSMRIGTVITLAIPVGVLVILAAFSLTAFYVWWANKSYDPEVARLKEKAKELIAPTKGETR